MKIAFKILPVYFSSDNILLIVSSDICFLNHIRASGRQPFSSTRVSKNCLFTFLLSGLFSGPEPFAFMMPNIDFSLLFSKVDAAISRFIDDLSSP